MYDVIIIGAGVIGCACARELSRYQLNICVVEKEEDVCCGTSKANSAIIHSGIDCVPGSLKAEMNLRGNALMEPLAKDLDFEFIRNGSLILCFSKEDLPQLQRLYEQGLANHVPDLSMLDSAQLQALEPGISKSAIAAIHAKSSGIVCPFGMNIALAENAFENGVTFLFDTEVTDITRIDAGYQLDTSQGALQASCIVNAAGVYADKFHNMVSSHKIQIIPRRGEYCLFDQAAGGLVSHTIFQLPTQYGKGVLVTPTVHGNLLIGPTAEDDLDKDATNTTADGLAAVCQTAAKSVPSLPMRQIITSFSGSRAHEDHGDFIIEQVIDAPFFIDAAGIESPGLTSAPAIGMRVSGIIAGLLHPSKKADFVATRTGILNPKHLSEEAYDALIKEHPAYGNVICRCEQITEGEIIDAVTRPLGAKSLDGVKRRTRAGMGRCQAGFCTPKTMEILAKARQISPLAVTKSGGSSHLVVGYSKNNIQENS